MTKKKAKPQYMLCVKNDAYPASLEVRKVYQALPDPVAEARNYVRVIDESGEDYLYPAEYFAPVKLSVGVALELASTFSQSFPRIAQKARRR